jgi:hypothetical protein
MRLANIIRLSTNILDSIAIPMVSRPRNQIVRILITTDPWLRHQLRMVAQVEPDVCASVDERQVRGLDVPATVLVVVLQCGGGGDAVVFAWRESPCAPLLGVGDLQLAGDERGAVAGGGLVGAGFGTGGVEVGAGCAVCGVGVVGLVLRAETAAVCAVDAAALAVGDEGLLDVVGVAA